MLFLLAYLRFCVFTRLRFCAFGAFWCFLVLFGAFGAYGAFWCFFSLLCLFFFVFFLCFLFFWCLSCVQNPFVKNEKFKIALITSFILLRMSITKMVFFTKRLSDRYLIFWYLVSVFGRGNCGDFQFAFPYSNLLIKLFKVWRQIRTMK